MGARHSARPFPKVSRTLSANPSHAGERKSVVRLDQRKGNGGMSQGIKLGDMNDMRFGHFRLEKFLRPGTELKRCETSILVP